MLEALCGFLESKGYRDISLDMIPSVRDRRDVIALFEWEHTVGSINDGSGVHYIQIQVRRGRRAAAYQDCKGLFELLDSGTEETLLQLTPAVFCIARPRRGPLKLEAGTNYATYYCETALWGPN